MHFASNRSSCGALIFQGVSTAARKVLLFDVLNDPRYRRSILVDNMALAGAAGTLNNAFITADALAVCVCVRCRMALQDASASESCRLAGRSVQYIAWKYEYSHPQGHQAAGLCVSGS